MNKYSKQIPNYRLIYWGYLGLSVVTMFVFLLALFYCFFSKFQENVTLSHLVLLLILLLLTQFFRTNALHYQNLIVQIELHTKPSAQKPPFGAAKGNQRRPATRGREKKYEEKI